MASKRTPRDPAEPHWLDVLIKTMPPLPTASPVDSEQGEVAPLPPRPTRPPLPDPLAPDPRFLELLTSLDIATEPTEETTAKGQLLTWGKPWVRLVYVCDQAGADERYARPKRTLSGRERDAVLDAFIIGQEMAHAQAVLLSDQSTQEERDSALAYVGRIRRHVAVRTADNEKWFRIAGVVDSLPQPKRKALPQLSATDGFILRGLLKNADANAAMVDALSDQDLGAALNAWHNPRRGRSKWGGLAALCKAIGVDPPTNKDAAKSAAKRARGGSEKRGS